MSINTDSTEKSQSSPDFKHEPIWLQSFLALFNCESIPKILFTRVAQPSTRWDNAGELVRVDLNCLHLVHPKFERLLGQPSWSERFTNIENRRSYVEDLIECRDAATDGLEKFSKESLLTILTIAASAFPEPWCEVIWEDVEEELWEVVESTCLPLLGVLDRDDIEIFLEGYLSNHRKSDVLFILITFFIRVSVLLASRTPPNLLQLISQSTELFRDYVKVGKDTYQEDLDYLLLSKLIAEILIDKDQLPLAAGRLHSLDHSGSMRANAAIGFALGALPTSRIGLVSNEYSKWTPILPDTPSTMEILVQSQLFGTIPLEELSSTGLEYLSLSTRVLMGFAEARKKAFFNTARILEPLIGDVERAYGKASLELLLIGTALVNSFNATEREIDGEKLGRYFWSGAFGLFATSRPAGPTQQTYLMVAISDSFLGQGKYIEARELLMEVLNHNSTDNNLVMSATLRLLKMSRRERSLSTLLEDWTRLGNAVRGFDKLSDILKYECIEETLCLLSVLEPDQIAKIPEASRIVKTLTDYRVSTYKGSTPSRLNLHRNLEELKRFKSKLNLFSISGPQLSYCRKLRERFLPASVQIIEKVGSANWQRFKRIKEIREMVVLDKVEPQTLAPAKSAFQDSGIGSSLKTDSIVPSPPKVARSVTSIRSFMSCEEGAMLLPTVPPATSAGERSCYICEKSIRDVENESQWRRHAFSDLRPYVCIVDDCDADHMDFASRAEFAAHLTEHQHTKLWACTQCGHTEEKKYLIRDHINSKHVTSDNGNRNVDIIQKQILRDLSNQSCPFCDEVPGAVKFVGHLCHHLEEISLSAIPRDAGADEDDEGESSSDASLSRRRIEEMVTRFDEPFDEMDMTGTATRRFSRDKGSPGIPFPFSTASQNLEQELRGQSKNRVDDVDFEFEDEDLGRAQALKDVLGEPQDLESIQQTSSYWSVSEQSDFPALLGHFGTDWQGIAKHMTTKSHVMVKNFYVRQVDSGKARDWDQIAKEADRKRERGETTAPLPSPTASPKRRHGTMAIPDLIELGPQNPIERDFALAQSPSIKRMTITPFDGGSSPKPIAPRPPQGGELASVSHEDSTVARDSVAMPPPKARGNSKRPRAEPVPQGFLNHTVSTTDTYSPIMDGVVSQEPASIGRRSLRPRHDRRPSRHSDSGLGSSVGSASGKRAGETAPTIVTEDSYTKSIVTTSAITRSAATYSSTIFSLPRLSARASNRIHEHILKPLLAKQSLKDFHPIVKDCPRRIHRKEILCLRDLEKTLIFMAPVSEFQDDVIRGVAHWFSRLKERTKTTALYLDFCLTSIRCIQATIEFLSDREQTRPHDRPYTNRYFVDLVDQIKQYAQQVQAAKGKEAKGEELDETDPESYVSPWRNEARITSIARDSFHTFKFKLVLTTFNFRTDEVKLHGGLTENGRPAELIRVKNGKATSIPTGKPVDLDEDNKGALQMKRSLSEEAEDVESILRSMARRKRSVSAAELAPKRCREPGCDKEFKRPCDLTKHEKTHSHPWKCPVESCKYHEYGWPTEKEMDRHYNDKHSTTAPLYECHFKPCTYRSKRESNFKQHMKKAHGWDYFRSRLIAKQPDFSQLLNDYDSAHPYEINQSETTNLYTSNVESSVADFSLFDNEDLYNAGVQLPYPGDFTSSTDQRASTAIRGIESISQGNTIPYTLASLHEVDEGFEDFVPTTTTGNDFQLFSPNPSYTFPSSMSVASSSGVTAQELLDFYAASTMQRSQHFPA